VRLASLAAGEGVRLARSALAFTLLLFGYYLIRPVRDGLAASLPDGEIKYLSSAVFATMLLLVPAFGMLAARLARERLYAAVLLFFASHLLIFAAVLAGGIGVWTARVFYVWVTVFNMSAVSVFWSSMADLWQEEQGRRLFGLVAAGGSLGGMVAPFIARGLALGAGLAPAVALAALCLALSVACLWRLPLRVDAGAPKLGGGALEGITLIASPFVAGIAGLVAIGSLLGMFVYIEMAHAVRLAYPDAATRTAFFAGRDLWVNAAACLMQAAVLARFTTRIGVGPTLMLGAAIAAAAFGWLAFAPELVVLTAVNVALRVTELGLAKPARDMLYTVVSPAVRFKAKNAIDTALYRASDMLSGFMHDALAGLGLSLAGFGALGVGFAAALGGVAALVGRGYRRRGGR
jgi:ATP:ADP antiporter, AAA family